MGLTGNVLLQGSRGEQQRGPKTLTINYELKSGFLHHNPASTVINKKKIYLQREFRKSKKKIKIIN